MYEFTDDCRIGIPAIDKEHEKLFSMVNEGYLLLSENEGKTLRPAAQKLLEHLQAYANTHFAHEEAYMEEIGDPELSSQRQEHNAFSQKMRCMDFRRLEDTDVKPALENLLTYLSRWLFRHILGSDTLIGKFESVFTFTSKYMTGIEKIDEEHRRLFRMIQETSELMHNDYIINKYDKIIDILTQLKNYTREHFSHEEMYMEKIHYPGLAKQRKAHNDFRDRLAEMELAEINEQQQEYLEYLMEFLLNWLSTHIMSMDKEIGDYVDSEGMVP